MLSYLFRSCDGKYFASLGGQDDNSVVVWETETGRAVCGSPAAQDSALCVKWLHRRNDRFVTVGNFHLRVWQVDVSIPKVWWMTELQSTDDSVLVFCRSTASWNHFLPVANVNA